jgi:hypothetical protein
MCEIVANWDRGNCASHGGVDEVIIYNMENRDEASVVVTSGVITAMDMNSGKKAWVITPDMESIIATFNGTRSRENNSYMVAETCAITLKDILTSTVQYSELLGKGYFGMIIKLADETDYIHLGFKKGMTLTTDEMTTGQLYEDMAGATLNFSGKSLHKPFRVSPSVVASITAPIS